MKRVHLDVLQLPRPILLKKIHQTDHSGHITAKPASCARSEITTPERQRLSSTLSAF